MIKQVSSFPIGFPDLADIRGLELPRLAVEVAAAGQHSLLLHGPAASGKTMLARRIAGILPDLDAATQAERAELVAYTRHADHTLERPPVRMPHHTVSVAGLLGNYDRPGEVSLAHGGVLVLDELPEFSRANLEGLRSVLEQGAAEFYRAEVWHRWPARCLLVGMTALCPCNWLGHPSRVCTDSPNAVGRYQARLAPLASLWDLAVAVHPATGNDDLGEPSAGVRARVELARQRRLERAGAELPLATGVELGDDLEAARLRRVATTLADLGHTTDATAITVDGLELARCLFQLPEAAG